MGTELFSANRAVTTVTSGGTDAPSSGTQETWTVASSSGFGAAVTGVSQFHVSDASPSAASEIIAVTNVSGTTWTVTRGAESTTPVAHADGFTVYQVVTAGFLAAVSASSSGSAATAGTAATALALNSATTTVAVSGAAAPTAGQVLTASSGTAATWSYGLTSVLTTGGDLLFESGALAPARLAGNTSAAKNFLTSTGAGGTANAPAWGTIAVGDVPTLNQNTTGTATTALAANALNSATTAVNVSAATAPTAGQVLAATSGTTAAWQQGMLLQASTGTAGYSLINGTGTIITWTPPNDGNLHRVQMMVNLLVTSAEAGGATGLSGLVSPDGAVHSPGLNAGSTGTGLSQLTSSYFALGGSAVTFAQTSALTGGTAILWADMWGY